MTVYLADVSLTSASASISMGILAVTYDIKIISATYNTLTTDIPTISRYTGASFSGGSSVTPVQMRQKAAACLATAKSGATASGTQTIFDTHSAAVGPQTFTPASELIISPGSAFVVSVNGSTGLARAVSIYFDELHLARST